MLEASGAEAEVDLEALPRLAGASDCLEAGVRSSLYPDNRKVWDRAANGASAPGHPAFPLLFDPQTAGGLLAGIPHGRVAECLSALHAAGYVQAARIGTVRGQRSGSLLSIRNGGNTSRRRPHLKRSS